LGRQSDEPMSGYFMVGFLYSQGRIDKDAYRRLIAEFLPRT